MRSVSDGVRLAWRSCLSFSGEAAKKLFACPSAFHTVAHSPTPSPPSCAFASTFPLVSLRGGCVVFDPTTPTDSTARSPSDAGEESRYPPHPPSLIPTFAAAADKRRPAARLFWQPQHGCISSFPLASHDHNTGRHHQPAVLLPPSLTTTHSFHHNTRIRVHPPSPRNSRQLNYEQLASAAPNAHCLRYARPSDTRRFSVGGSRSNSY